MFEILVSLFENYMNGNVILSDNNDTLLTELEKVGFDRCEISRALNWLNELNQLQSLFQANPAMKSPSLRYYLPEETERLGVEGISLLMRLEQASILDPAARETVIDRLMALDPIDIEYRRIKWVVLMTLFHQPEKRAALLLLQDMILTEASSTLH